MNNKSYIYITTFLQNSVYYAYEIGAIIGHLVSEDTVFEISPHKFVVSSLHRMEVDLLQAGEVSSGIPV